MGEDDDEDDAGNSVASVVAAAVAVVTVAVAAVWGEVDWLAGPGTSAAADVWAVLETACGDGGRARGLEEDTCRTATLARAPQSADTSCDWASATCRGSCSSCGAVPLQLTTMAPSFASR